MIGSLQAAIGEGLVGALWGRDTCTGLVAYTSEPLKLQTVSLAAQPSRRRIRVQEAEARTRPAAAHVSPPMIVKETRNGAPLCAARSSDRDEAAALEAASERALAGTLLVSSCVIAVLGRRRSLLYEKHPDAPGALALAPVLPGSLHPLPSECGRPSPGCCHPGEDGRARRPRHRREEVRARRRDARPLQLVDRRNKYWGERVGCVMVTRSSVLFGPVCYDGRCPLLAERNRRFHLTNLSHRRPVVAADVPLRGCAARRLSHLPMNTRPPSPSRVVLSQDDQLSPPAATTAAPAPPPTPAASPPLPSFPPPILLLPPPLHGGAGGTTETGPRRRRFRRRRILEV